MLRRTKIVSTLGPASESEDVLEKLILAGVNVVRLNFSHGAPEDHKNRAEAVRRLAAKHDRFVAVLGDLQGPKIRIARFADGPIKLAIGDKFILDASLERDAGNQERVGIDYKELRKTVSPATSCCWMMVAWCWTWIKSKALRYFVPPVLPALCLTTRVSTVRAVVCLRRL